MPPETAAEREIRNAGLLNLIVILTLGSAPTLVRSEAVRFSKIEERTAQGVMRGMVAVVDLSDPRVEVVVDGALTVRTDEGASARVGDSELVTTDEWAAREKTVVAVNANFFATLGKDGKPTKTPDYRGGVNGDIIGLSVSDGVVVSPAREVDGKGDPALVFGKDGRAKAALVTAKDVDSTVWDAVAGVGKGSGPEAGTLLVEGGKSKADSARVEPSKRHPRTVAGVSKDGRTLVLIVVDGRQKDWSVGATLGEMAELLLARGVHSAVALDGGGSTAMVFDPTPGGKAGDEEKNKPSDGSFRPVANHLGIRLKECGAVKAGPKEESVD